MKIGNVEIENNIFLAPMAGITDLPFRLMCKKYGAGLVYTEMVSSKALFYGDEKTKKLLLSEKKEKPLAVQIFGSDVEAIKYSVRYLNDFADIIDINMGCPAPKVVKNGDGSKLLLNLDLVKEIVEGAVSEAKVPITVKMRIGWDSEHIVALEAAKIIEDAGASAIAVHGRTRSQFYSGTADWNIIKQIKDNAKIPIIGNGDIRTPQDAKRMLEQTNVDAIMIGRATLGNPWIFREVLQYLKTGELISGPTPEERLDTIKEHIRNEIEIKGEDIAIKEMRKHIAGYTKNLKDASMLRDRVNHLDTEKEVIQCLEDYFNKIK
jgi:tRNA-dihydrouridine synthase B